MSVHRTLMESSCITFMAFLLGTITATKDFSAPSSITLGGIFPADDTTSQYAFRYAIEEYQSLFQSEFDITINHRIETTGNRSAPGMAALDAVSHLLDDNSVVGIVGFDDSLDIVVTSDTLDQATIPYISYRVALNDYTYADEYPYFFRVLADGNALSVAVAKLFDYYNWESAVYIYESGLDGRTLDPLIINSDTFALSFTDLIEIKSDDTVQDIMDRLPIAESLGSQIFLVNANEQLLFNLFTAARAMNLTDSGFGWIMTAAGVEELETTELATCAAQLTQSDCGEDAKCIWANDECASLEYEALSSMEGVVAIKPEGPSPFFIEANQFHSQVVSAKQVCVIDWWVYYVYDATVLLLEALYEGLKNDDTLQYPFTFSRLDDEYQIGFAGQDAVDLYGFNEGYILKQHIANITVPQKGSISSFHKRGALTGSFTLGGANTRVEGFELVNLQGDSWLSVATIESTACVDYNECECGFSEYGSCCWQGFCRSNSWEFFADPTWSGHATSVPIGGIWSVESVAKVGFVLQVPNGYYSLSPTECADWSTDNKYCYNCTVTGYFPAMWDEIARRVGIEYEVVCIYPKGYTDITKDVASEDYTDIVIGDFTVNSDRASRVDFVYPYENSGRLVIFDAPGEDELAWMFLRPFSWWLWILLLGSIVWIAHLIWILEWNEDTFLKPLTEIDHDDTCCCRWLSWSWLFCAKKKNMITWPVCCCCRWVSPFFEPSRYDILEIEDEDHGIIEPGVRMPYPEAIEKALYMAWSTWYFTQDSPESYKAKWLLIFWQFVMLVITAAYTANMAAFLVVTNYEDVAISSESDILSYEDSDGRPIGVTLGGSNENYLVNRMGVTNYFGCDSLTQCLEKLTNGEVWGVIYDGPPLVFQSQQVCEWVTGPSSSFDPFLLAWPISKTTIPAFIKLQIDQAMLEMFSDGTAQLYYDNFIGNLNKCGGDDGPDETTPIQFDDLSSLWAIFGGLSGLLFLHFLCFRKASDQIKLREIRKEKISLFEAEEDDEPSPERGGGYDPPIGSQPAEQRELLTMRTDTMNSNVSATPSASPFSTPNMGPTSDNKYGQVKKKKKTYTHQSRGLRTQLRGTIDALTQKITDDHELKKLERQQKGDIQYIVKKTRTKAMKDFVGYLCEVEPHFNETKLKKMLRNEDMSQSEVQSLWRVVSALNEPTTSADKDESKVYYDYVFAFAIGDEPDWMPEVRDYANFSYHEDSNNTEEEKKEIAANDRDLEGRIAEIMSGSDGNETLNKECKDLFSAFEDQKLIASIVKHILVSWQFKKLGDIDDPDNVQLLKEMFRFEERVFHLHLIFKKYRREHIRKLLLDLEHEQDGDKKLALETDLQQVVPEWEAYYKLYKQYKTQEEERQRVLKAERRKERDKLNAARMDDIKEEEALESMPTTVDDAMKDMSKKEKKRQKQKKEAPKKRKISKAGLGGGGGRAGELKKGGAAESVFGMSDLSRTNVLSGVGNDALQDARDAVRELRDKIKPFLESIRVEDSWTTYAEQAAELLERLHDVGLDLKVWRSERDKIIFCLVGFPHKNMLYWADQRDVDIAIDPSRAIMYGQDDMVQCKLALKTASREEEALVQAAMEEESKEGLFYRFKKSVERIAKQSANRLTISMRSNDDDDDDDLDFPRTEQKLSRALWENIYCQYITKKDLQFIYREIFAEPVRLRLFYELLVSDENEGGAEIPIDWFEETSAHCLESCYPLHDLHERDRLIRDLVSVDSIWDFMKRLPERAPIDRLRLYYGEPIGFYFAFLNYYIRWLRYPSVVGTAYFLYQLIESNISVRGIIGAVLVTVIWSVAFVDFWKREESEWRVKWGMHKYAEKAVNRAQFDGDWVTDDVTGEDVEIYNMWARIYKMTVSSLILFTLIAAVLATVYAIFQFRFWLEAQNLGWIYWPQLIAGLANAVQIIIFDTIYNRISNWLNDWENHSTQQVYENAMIAKMFTFKFINTFNSLFILAFIIRGTETERLGNLRIQLISLFGSALTIQNIMEIAIPELKAWFKSVLRRFKYNHSNDEEEKEKEALTADDEEETDESGISKAKSIEGQLDMVTYDNTLEDMSELIIQYGYVTLFVVVFPIAPLLAYISNLFELRVDLTKVVAQCKRPHIIGSYGLGTWVHILSVFQILAVACNLAIFSFATNRVNDLLNLESESKDLILPNFSKIRVIFFLASSLGFVCAVAIIKALIPDEPGWVTKHLSRQELIENVLVLGALTADNQEKKQKLDVSLESIMRDGMITWDELPTFQQLKEMGAFKTAKAKADDAKKVYVPSKVVLAES